MTAKSGDKAARFLTLLPWAIYPMKPDRCAARRRSGHCLQCKPGAIMVWLPLVRWPVVKGGTWQGARLIIGGTFGPTIASVEMRAFGG